MKPVKKLIKKALSNYGYDVVPHDEAAATAEKNKYRWLQAHDIHTVIDAGSSDGGFARWIHGQLPEARVISFEAQDNLYQRLMQRMEGEAYFEAHRMALNNYNGTTTFRISSYDGSSSLLPMAELHKSAYPVSKNITEVTVDCKRLDDVLDAGALKQNVLFKLDVQGGEKLVLEGAEDVLARTRLVFCEINFQELYEGCVMANDLVDFLSRRGFRLTGIENVSQHMDNGTFLQADAWFQK